MSKNSKKTKIITAIILVVFLLMSVLPFLPASFWGGAATPTTHQITIPTDGGSISVEDLENAVKIESNSETSETSNESAEEETPESETTPEESSEEEPEAEVEEEPAQ